MAQHLGEGFFVAPVGNRHSGAVPPEQHRPVDPGEPIGIGTQEGRQAGGVVGGAGGRRGARGQQEAEQKRGSRRSGDRQTPRSAVSRCVHAMG